MLAFVENLEDQHYVQYVDFAQANRNAATNCQLSVSRATPTKKGSSYGSAWLHDRSCRVRSTLLVPAGGGRSGGPTNAMQPGPDDCGASCINVRSVNCGQFCRYAT